MVEKKYDLVIIGGGIIGLATAMRISDEFPKTKVQKLKIYTYTQIVSRPSTGEIKLKEGLE